MDDALEQSLRLAIAAAPGDVPLKVLLAGMILEAGDNAGAIALAADALSIDPTHVEARSIMSRAITPSDAPGVTGSAVPDASGVAVSAPPAATSESFDWNAAESDVDGVVEPMFAEAPSEQEPQSAFRVEKSTVTLKDVGGMTGVKDRLTAAFLAPLQNPELKRLYGKSLRGGLLMYGPPGCGKTFIARAMAGELGAQFISVSLADVLDPFVGQSERNVKELFDYARRSAPVVLFLDEIDALGQKRSSFIGSAGRGTVNQLLTELDGVDGSNEGVFVLAATNQPWDIDPALRRPGRLDRTVLVLPPDRPAREAIFRYHLSNRPVEAIDLSQLAANTEGYSGADIAYVCEVAAERALTASALSGNVRLIAMADVVAAIAEIQPSTKAWLSSARNVVMFGDDDGTYAELKTYLKKVKRL